MQIRSALSTYARLALVAGVTLAAAGSASSRQNTPPAPGVYDPPPPRSMDSRAALGLWRTSFGPVKIEADEQRGSRHLMGVWVYDRGDQEIVGYFAGTLEGNVLEFQWNEPADPEPLTGAGYLVFEQDGASFHGKWWTDSGDRSGDWTGWRHGDGHDSAPADDGYDDPAYDDGRYDEAEGYDGGGYDGRR